MAGDGRGSTVARERVGQIDCSHLKFNNSSGLRVSDRSIGSRMERTCATLGANDKSGVFDEIISTSGFVSIHIPPLCCLRPGCEKSRAKGGEIDGVNVFRRLAIVT